MGRSQRGPNDRPRQWPVSHAKGTVEHYAITGPNNILPEGEALQELIDQVSASMPPDNNDPAAPNEEPDSTEDKD